MQLVSTSRGDEGDTARFEMRAKLARLDEVVLLPLARIELQREWVASEVVQRVTEARRTRCVDCEHVQPVWVSVRENERRCLELATYTKQSYVSESGM